MTTKNKTDVPEVDSRDLLQAVVLTFDDGTTATFSGRAVCLPGDARTISRVQFTEPKPLPDDCHFDSL
jgi:hypothetical protein